MWLVFNAGREGLIPRWIGTFTLTSGQASWGANAPVPGRNAPATLILIRARHTIATATIRT